jgi:hypothetical protein
MSVTKKLRKKSGDDARPLTGHSIFKKLAVSPKRYTDTNLMERDHPASFFGSCAQGAWWQGVAQPAGLLRVQRQLPNYAAVST